MAGAPATPVARLVLYVQGTSLKNKDLASKSDPICTLHIKDRQTGGRWLELGRTEMIKNSLNPVFKKTFEIPFYFEEKQELKFTLYDVDNATQSLADDDYLGHMECTVAEIVGSRGQRLVKHLLGKSGKSGNYGQIAVTAEELATSGVSDLTIQFSGRHLAKKDLFGKSDPYLIMLRKKPDGTDVEVIRTETLMKTLDPNWQPIHTDTVKLCNNDYKLPITWTVWDMDKTSRDDQIGVYHTCLEEMLEAKAGGRELKLKHPRGKDKDVGVITIPRLDVIKRPTFVDFLRGGCEINLLVAVDFTASNKNPAAPDSLHYMNPQAYNEYQSAIISVGEVLQPYDSDGLFPVFGFGGKLPTGQVSHCFPLNGQPANPYCTGVGGILQAYSQALTAVQLYGPTNFAEIIRMAATTASAHVTQQQQKYFVLLILTDGEITDISQTIQEIVRASSLPLSIVIVGVGSADFSAMRKLDGDEIALSTGGQKCQRDIVQFVEFRKHAHNPAALAAEVLYEIPGQLLSFFKSRNIVPNAPLQPLSATAPPPGVAGVPPIPPPGPAGAAPS